MGELVFLSTVLCTSSTYAAQGRDCGCLSTAKFQGLEEYLVFSVFFRKEVKIGRRKLMSMEHLL